MAKRLEVQREPPQDQKVTRERRVSHSDDEKAGSDGQDGRSDARPRRADTECPHQTDGHDPLQKIGQQHPPPERVDPLATDLEDHSAEERCNGQRVVEQHAAAFGVSHPRQIEQREAPVVDDVIVPGDQV